ncbi:MAG TPA: formimidoylglutamase [Chitinophagales bacterium]|jgi:arginase family enzyme|nr:formimidoylglutamase [Chitinophagales bacterium]
MITKLLTPVRTTEALSEWTIQSYHWAKRIQVYTEPGNFPETTDCLLAIIGLPESRGSLQNSGSDTGADIIRKHVYQLAVNEYPLQLIDAGDIIPGETPEDTWQHIKMVMEWFLGQQILPILIGGSQDNTIGQYLGYEFLGQAVNLTVLDERIDLDDPEYLPPARTWLQHIFKHEPKYLFNYSAIAYQTHFNAQEVLRAIDDLFFDATRLGRLKENIQFAEPEVRDADLMSIDISCIRAADAPGIAHATPNGLSGWEICQIMRYAGMSDKITSLGIYEYNPMFDNQELTAKLIAQMIWYFVDGYYNRKSDYPIVSEKDFTKYIVNVAESDYDLTFWKSMKSGRWWVEVPFVVQERFERHQLVPCSYEDYENSLRNDVPEKWLRIFHKLS